MQTLVEPGPAGFAQATLATSRPPVREFVSSVEFSVFGPEEIKRYAVVNVTEALMYSSSLPVANGTADHRMGSVDRRLLCGTCRQGVNECPGHAGAIQLNYPVLHPSFADVVLKILKVTCFFCSELLLSDSDRAQLGEGERGRKGKGRKQRLSDAVLLAKNKKSCLSCGGATPQYAKQGQVLRCDFSKVSFSDPDEAQYCQRPFTAAEIRMILQSIKDEDCLLLGLDPKVTRPEYFVLTALMVPPPIVRPSVSAADGGKVRGQDDLTGKICDILKANAAVKAVLEREAGSIARVGLSLAAQQAVADLSFHISTFINNDLRGQRQSVQRSGLPTRSIISRLKGKEGRIRGYLMGKRVDFSARSVISPDSQMDVDQVGVPEVVARKLTVPVWVLPSNLEAVRELVRDAASPARTICRQGRCVVVLEFADREKEARELTAGDVVERRLLDDDIVLFNRQPSLHKGSMMGYRVLIFKGSRTFRLNLACTGVSNADYDGDEMNVHVPQDPESQAEARMLMSVPENIVSAQSNKPSVGLVQDTIVGAWLLTGEEVTVTRLQMCQMRLGLRYPCGEVPDGASFTGRQAFSMLLPRDLSYAHDRSGVLVERGVLVSGRLCRQTLGTTSGSLVHHLWLFHGPEVAKRFLSDAQRMINRWLGWRGFSIRLSDCEPDPTVVRKMQALVALVELKASRIAEDAYLKTSPPEMLEEAVASIANRALTDAGKIVHASLREDNALYQDVTSGAKGNLVNVTQLLGLVGQQSVEGNRVDPTAPLSTGLARKGFVKHPYFQGLSGREFFAHTMAGREGLIDTSVKTASTGYLQRRLMKAMETLAICYDGTCRNARQTIVQFVYGSDGYDAMYLVRQSLDALRLTRAEIQQVTMEAERPALLEAWARVLASRCKTRSRSLELAVYVPVPLDALVRSLQRAGSGPGERRVEPAEHLQALDSLCQDVCPLRHGRRWGLELLLRWMLRVEVATSLSAEGLSKVMSTARDFCHRAEVAAGEAVGPLASTSIGEPLTQLTLNTFHSCGVKEKNVTLGVPRIKELIDATRNPKTPSMTLVVAPGASSGEGLEKLRLCLPETVLSMAVISMELLLEPDFFVSHRSPLDQELAAREALLREGPPSTFGLYVARLRLDPGVLAPRSLGPGQVADLVEGYCPCHVSCSEELHDEWILRLRFTQLGEQAGPPEQLRAATEELVHRLCRDVILSGIAGIQRASAQEDSYLRFGEDGCEVVRCSSITTQGSNLLSALSMPQFQAQRCVSNDIHEVASVLGIEAATTVLFEQMQYVLQFDGSYVNERHILLLVSFMTCLGGLLPVSRHGINKLVDSGPLARASFEEVADRLAESAIFGDVDPVLCHSSKIMVGEPCRVGTGMCEVLEPEEDPAATGRAAQGPEGAEGEDVVFTCVDMSPGCEDPEMLCYGASRPSPIEMPFSDGSSRGVQAQTVISASLVHVAPDAKNYAPTSPKNIMISRKRGYEPSTPKLRAGPSLHKVPRLCY